MIKRIKENKILLFLSILIIGIIIVLIIRFTYAYLAAAINEARENVTLSSDTTDNLKFELGNPLSINATPTTLPINGDNLVSETYAKAMLTANSTNDTAEYTYLVYFNITNNTLVYSDGSTPEVILSVTDPNGNEVTSIDGLSYGNYNGVNGFDVTTQNGIFTIATNYSIVSNSSTTITEQTWNIKLTYLNQDYDQSINFGNSMTTEVNISKNAKVFADYIMYDVYTGIDGENGLYYHDGEGTYVNVSQEAGDNSYRYSGANPNNYVCFGSDEETCVNDNLYRIIGIFDDDNDGVYNIKLIKYDYVTSDMLGTNSRDYSEYYYDTSAYKGNMDPNTIAGYTWNYDTSVSEGGSNNWTTSELNTINLNTNFLNYLKNIDDELIDMISSTTWYLGGTTDYNYTAKTFYESERNNRGYENNPTIYQAKIGLLYPSDYGYATTPNNWSLNLYNYNKKINDNWMYMGLTEYTITPRVSADNMVFLISTTGPLNSNNSAHGHAVRPVFYLDSDVIYVSGDGSEQNPFRIGL